MVKRVLLACCLMAATTSVIFVQAQKNAKVKEQKLMERVEKALDQLPDSAFSKVKAQDLLDDQVYRQLQRDGWSQQEIERIMTTVLRDRNAARSKGGYSAYAKEWLPFQRMGVNDSIYGGPDMVSIDGGPVAGGALSSNPNIRYAAASEDPTDPDAGMTSDEFFNKSWPEIPYTPDDRKAGRRNPGYWRPAKFKPSSGRVHWGVVHPTDPDKVMFMADGASIWRTDNCLDINGWRNITDNIPSRAHRTTAGHSAIPVDPDDWDHLFAFMTSNGNTVWETKDGGNTWRQIKGATHYSFKRGYCFRDAEGNLKFIGAIPENWSIYPGRAHNRLMISEDTCKTWTNLKDQLVNPEGFDMRDWLVPVEEGKLATKGLWFQEFAFDTKDRNRIYIPTSRSILYFDDGAKSTLVGKVRKYNLKKLRLRVHGRTLDSPLLNDTCPYAFPIPAHGAGHMVVDPKNPSRMWFATGNRNNTTALYFSENRGEDWITLFDQWRGIGRISSSGGVFGNEIAFVWLGGFAVNLANNNFIYGCSMSSAWINSNWQNGEEVVVNHQGWGGSRLHLHDDGNYYYSSHARHQADSHFMMSHPSGRVYRGCDGGLLIIDTTVNASRAMVHIDGNANQMLCYRVQCNEFGDQSMATNTQDIDVQFYRNGRWGMWAGYEGCFSAINPYTNVVWYPLGGSWGLDAGNFSCGSWAECVTRADVVNNTFYSVNTDSPEGKKMARWDDLGRSCEGLDVALGGVPGYNNWNLCRDKGRCTIYAVVGGKLRRSINQGKTFEDVLYNGNPLSITGVITTDPDNSDIIYVGQQGQVVKVDLANSSMAVMTKQGLPNHGCSQLIFHEGTGDLYFINNSAGIWYLRNGASEWKFWLKGYNPTKGNSHVINYATQEMIFSDYGRGIWVADLQRPADRYFKNGFKLKELSNNDGIKTIGIDTYWTIPLYYYYKWTVNGMEIENPYQNLTSRLKPGDKVQLKLTLRESPDVSTLSEVFTVPETTPTRIEHVPGNALYSDGKGRVDLGFYNHYLNDFTVDFWVNPESDGFIIGNRQREDHPGAKGWLAYVDGGNLKFLYEPKARFNAASYERNYEVSYGIDCGRIELNKWHHVAIAHQRNGNILIYLDGKLAGQQQRNQPEDCINNSVCLSLFGDGIDRYPMKGSVDELKVWKRALGQDEIRKEMYSTNNLASEDLIMHYDFNQSDLSQNLEEFARYIPHSKIRAVTSAVQMPVPLCANTSAALTAKQNEPAVFSIENAENQTVPFATLTSRRQQDLDLGFYTYNAADWKKEDDNMLSRYYDIEPTAMMIHSFSVTDPSETIDLSIHPALKPFNPNLKYRLYWSEQNSNKPFWNLVGELSLDPETGSLNLPGAKVGDLLDRRLIVVAPKPALEVTIKGLNTKGEFEVMSPEQAILTLDVHALQGLEEPVDGYEIISDNGLIIPQGKLEFQNGAATLKMRIDMSSITERGQKMTTTLRGKNSDIMIPLEITIVNKLTNLDAGTGLRIDGGWAMIGNRDTYQKMTGSTHYTLSGWFRFDDPSGWVANGHNNFLFFCTSGLNGFGFVANKKQLTLKYPGVNLTGVSCNLDSSTAGKWMYITMVADGTTLKFYLNGHLMNTMSSPYLSFSTSTGLMLGAPNNNPTYTYCTGAFDQIGVWNRSLSQKEIAYYMQNRVTLDSPDLITYTTMEEVDGQDRMVDMVSGATVVEYGTIVKGEKSLFPYNPEVQTDGSTGPLTVTYPAGKQRSTIVSTFPGQSANFLAQDNNDIIPLNREHYTIAFDAPGNVGNTDQVTLTYTHPTIRKGDAVKMGTRPFGAVSEFYSNFLEASSVEDGVATFTLPFSQLGNNLELMAFVPRSEELRAAAVTTQINDPALEITDGRVKLRESDSSIPVTVRLTSGQVSQPVSIYVKESEYATPSVQTVDFSNGDVVTFNINIDRSKLNTKGLNPVSVTLPGIDGAELNFQVYLEPLVNLRLLNGKDDHTFLATTPIVDLDIEARLVHGWLDRPVDLEITTDLSKLTSIGNGTLLSNNPVRISNLEHHYSFNTEVVEGWNLIGNPYLANINLTKSQNVKFDSDKITKFVYTYNHQTGNYEAFDMTRYEARQRIKPFESYFVQTLTHNASLTVTPVATEVSPTKKTATRAAEARYANLELLVDGKVADRVTMIWDDQASDAFVLNEDAPKFWSINTNTNQLCFMASDMAMARNAVGAQSTPTSICSVNEFEGATPLGLKLTTPGRVEIRLAGCSEDIANQALFIKDNISGDYFELSADGEPVEISGAKFGQLDTRFSFLRKNPTIVGINQVINDSPYTVETAAKAILVKGLKGDATVSIFKPNGILVLSQHITESNFKALVESGYYIVTINENDKEYSVKVGVK